MIGTAGLPHVIMRFFTVPSVKAARLSAGWALLFIAILYTTAPAVAAMARLNFITTIDQPSEESNLSYANRPSWFRNWEVTGLLKFEDKNQDIISYLNKSEQSKIFVAWGAFAHNQLKDVNTPHHLLVSSHPSPLSHFQSSH